VSGGGERHGRSKASPPRMEIQAIRDDEILRGMAARGFRDRPDGVSQITPKLLMRVMRVRRKPVWFRKTPLLSKGFFGL
jgi:hypothetical protein